jgi:glucan 1,3-beta-glucosidase
MTFLSACLVVAITVLSTRSMVVGLPLLCDPNHSTTVSEAPYYSNDCVKHVLQLTARTLENSSAIGAEYIFYGLTYSPFGLGDERLCPPWNNKGGKCLPQDQLLADLRQIGMLTKRIKLYSCTCLDGTKIIMDYAIQNRLEITLGVWISGKSSEDESEFEHLQELMSQYANVGVVKSIVVGNEAVFRIGMGIEQVASAITRVRSIANGAGSKALIGTADIFSIWMKQPQPGAKNAEGRTGADMEPIVKVLDFIGLNSHPYYGRIDATKRNGADKVLSEQSRIRQYWNARGYNIPVWITETGYPTVGNSNMGAAPSAAGLEAFASQMETASRQNNLPVYFFEPYDGDWKRRWEPFTEADYSFGLMTCNRTPKQIILPPPGAI